MSYVRAISQNVYESLVKIPRVSTDVMKKIACSVATVFMSFITAVGVKHGIKNLGKPFVAVLVVGGIASAVALYFFGRSPKVKEDCLPEVMPEAV